MCIDIKRLFSKLRKSQFVVKLFKRILSKKDYK